MNLACLIRNRISGKIRFFALYKEEILWETAFTTPSAMEESILWRISRSCSGNSLWKPIRI